MKKFWIKDVLENRLHNKVRIELGLEERYDAINYPWTMVWETPDQSRHTLSPGTRVIDKFDELGVGRSLLILGEPGAGKTITLLELARDLIERAEQDIDCPIPVVLPLASWGNAKMRRTSMIQKKQSSFEDCLVEEISKYNISKKIVQAWLNNQKLLLLLDGLDEVSVNYQQECVQSLNYFRQKYGQTEIVVCSRVQEYESLPQRLNFQAAIYLQPLTVQQIELFFAEAGSELEVVRVMFQQDTTLQELAKSPLMLDIIALTYQGVSIEDFPANKSVKEYRQHLFNDYIERMFFRHRKRHNTRQYKFAKSEVKNWLTWLAQRMLQNSQSIFIVDQIQPELLKFNKLQQRLYCFFSSLIPIITFSISGYILGMQDWGWRNEPSLGISTGFMNGLLFIFMMKFTLFIDEEQDFITLTKSLKTKDIVLSCSSVFLLTFAIWFLKIHLKWITEVSLLYIIQGCCITLFWFNRISIFSRSRNIDEYKAEKELEKRSALNIVTSSIVLLLASTLSGILCGNLIFICILMTIFINTGHKLFIHTWDFFILGWKLYLGISKVQHSAAMDLKYLLKYFTELGFSVGLSSGFLFTFIFIFSDVNRFTIRFILYINRVIPWNYKHFLKYAKEIIFLQKVGDGYIFIHRLLLEYFASLKYDHSLEAFFFRVEARSYFRSKNFNYVYAEALKLCQTILKDNHSEIENNIPKLVGLYYQQENFVETENLEQAATTLLKSLVSQNHHYVAYSLYSLANIYHEQECHIEAESIYRLALRLTNSDKSKIGIEINILIALGMLVYESNYNQEAKSLFLKTLKLNNWLCERGLIKVKLDDLTVSYINQILSNIFLEQKNYKKAEDFLLQALELRKKLLGEEHLDVLDGFVALAHIYELQNRFIEAEALYEKVFEIRLRILGECHLQTIDSLHKLADTYYCQKQFSEAESRYLKVIELRKQLLGKDNPNLVVSLYDLGMTYYMQARHQEAELLLVQALEILERQLEEDFSEEVHSNMMLIRKNIDAVQATLHSEQETE
ncbi:tetratricopeptide repeat protein [Nostoc sp. DedSLP03]|uniref:tetratricopeptide repeat protein n=1 Tax=Nostoc sp. DedSLP03 TaxID=3075400 RepID=UPI002AD2C90E|nr:tetratricopeptide repeat protein [Nostoc sp. DedSLP03]